MTISATITVNNLAGIAADKAAAVQMITASALSSWSASLAGNASLRVTVDITSSTPSGRANGGNEVSSYLGTVGGYGIYEPGAAHELRTGIDSSSAQSDIRISIDPGYLDQLWFDLTLDTANDIPTRLTDAYTVFAHEIGHALGMIGYWQEASNTFSSNAKTIYDTRLVLRNGEAYFDGPNVRALLGDGCCQSNANSSLVDGARSLRSAV